MTETARALESLLAFWIDSGVDSAIDEAPLDHLASPSPPAASPLRSPAVRATSPTSGDDQPSDAGPILALAVAEAQTAAAGAGDLDALAATIARFDACPLKAGARQAVFARGRPDAPIMIIGEAPGADEDSLGKPFVGRAGKLLDVMLGAAGLADEVFIINTVFWRPPGNRTPTAAEQAICAPFVERAIRLAQPRALLLAGGASAKFMLGRSEGILALRGRWIEWRSADETLEIPALPTLHPAFLLRQPAAKKKSWTDMLMLAERIRRPARPG